MRQKKKIEGSKLEADEKQESCVKCSKLQNGRQGSPEEAETQTKQTTLGSLKSVLKRTASHKREKTSAKNADKTRETNYAGVRGKAKNRVQFDETRNKYFEADYVILIHDEDYDLDDYYDEGSPYDDDEEEEVEGEEEEGEEEEEEAEEDEDDDGLDGGNGSGRGKTCCSNPDCSNAVDLTSGFPGYVYAVPGHVTNLNHPRVAAIERDRFDFSNRRPETNRNVRITSAKRCENDKCPNCSNYFDFEMSFKPETSQDYGDQVTLSPPEGYKDGGGGTQCCQHHGFQFQNASIEFTEKRISTPLAQGAIRFEEEEGEREGPIKCQRNEMETDEAVAKAENGIVANAKCPADDDSIRREEKPEKLKQRFIVETITMTTVTERRIVTESNQSETTAQIAEETETEEGGGGGDGGGGGGGGILKGGKFWKNCSAEKTPGKSENQENREKETPNGEERADGEDDDGNEDPYPADVEKIEKEDVEENESKSSPEPETAGKREKTTKQEGDEAISPESTELTLTFKLGHQLLVSNSLKPNSAMRQLFPNPRFLSPPPPSEDGEPSANPIPPKQFLVAAESLKLFEESNSSKFSDDKNSRESERNYIVPTGPSKINEDTQCNESLFQRTIERNTLRRSLVKYSYEYRNKRLSEKKKKANENSLEERIRQLTCGVDEEVKEETGEGQEEPKGETGDSIEPTRSSPQGEESRESRENANVSNRTDPVVSTFPVNPTSGNSTYRKLTDLFSRKQSNPGQIVEDVNRNVKTESAGLQCDLVLNSENLTNVYTVGCQSQRNSFVGLKSFQPRLLAGSDAKKQFLSTLAPLAACVNPEGKAERYGPIEGGDRFQPAGRESEHYVQDAGDGPKKLGNQPDVIAETPQSETPNDELALFVQQDRGRIDKLKKRYGATDDKSDDEDDYGFNKRPFVKGIKTRFEATCDNPCPSLATRGQGHRVTCPNNKLPPATATATVHTNWPYYSQENAVSKPRQIYGAKSAEEGNSYGSHGITAEHRNNGGCFGTGNGTYTECRGPTPVQKPNHSNQCHQQNAHSVTNAFYRCHPIRFGGYTELSNYRFRHPPRSPPPMRRFVATNAAQPISSDECNVKLENRIFFNRTAGTYGNAIAENCVGPKPNFPDVPSLVSPSNERPTIPESTYRRRTVPNVHNPCLQMKFSPVNYHQGVVPTASIRFSASCSPHAILDDTNLATDPHYSELTPNSGQGNAVGVIRVEQGQQMIRVPVPYATGTPVQVHLMTGRLGRCESPQKPGSPQGPVKVPVQPLSAHNHCLVAKGIQTVQAYSAAPTASPPPPANPPPDEKPTKTVDFEKQGKAIAEELQHRQKSALSRTVSQEGNYQVRPGTLRCASPVIPHERGVPEGAASSSVHDCQPLQPKNPASQAPGNTVYYTMNV